MGVFRATFPAGNRSGSDESIELSDARKGFTLKQGCCQTKCAD